MSPCSRFGSYLSGNLSKFRYRMIEELLISLTEVAFSAVIFFIERRPVLHTTAPTNGQVSADEAFVAEFLLVSGKSSLLTAGGKFFYRRLKDVAQPPLRLNEKITAESVAGMLDHDVLAAL